MRTYHTVTFAGLVGALLLAGCADHRTRRDEPAPSPAPSATRATPKSSAGATAARPAAAPDEGAAAADADASSDAPIGIPACDDYLSSYRGCHRTAAIYAPDEIEHRYEMMHQSLLRDSRNPQIRPQLAARCNSLASTLRQALHGKACQMTPAEAASSGSD
ncbi:hypothetical protein [Dyella sp.]|jgi:hypothetical protein|uniref:hypothetical protein n=1 Tax=Dyella sp. TaxID=1869338 RepID=UPI002D79BC4E|nr:hypothetical protein [Dyella sp.]HET6430967.1 hypothetical protein [Dyella sp.]